MVIAKSNLIVEGKKVKTIIDTGVFTNIITEGLCKKLKLKFNESSTIFTIANEKEVPSLEKTTIEITIKNIKIPVKVQVIDSNKKTLF